MAAVFSIFERIQVKENLPSRQRKLREREMTDEIASGRLQNEF
jgi:hypothetical protein